MSQPSQRPGSLTPVASSPIPFTINIDDGIRSVNPTIVSSPISIANMPTVSPPRGYRQNTPTISGIQGSPMISGVQGSPMISGVSGIQGSPMISGIQGSPMMSGVSTMQGSPTMQHSIQPQSFSVQDTSGIQTIDNPISAPVSSGSPFRQTSPTLQTLPGIKFNESPLRQTIPQGSPLRQTILPESPSRQTVSLSQTIPQGSPLRQTILPESPNRQTIPLNQIVLPEPPQTFSTLPVISFENVMSQPSLSRSTLPSLSKLPSLSQQYPSGLPSLSQQYPSGLPSLGRVTGYQTLPRISQVEFPNLTGTKLPGLTLPGLEIPNYQRLSTYIPFILVDNERANLNWKRANPPQPLLPNQKYMRIGCIGDGNCFFHALAKGQISLYRQSYDQVDIISEEQIQMYEIEVGRELFPAKGVLDKPRGPTRKYKIINRYMYNNIMDAFRREYVMTMRRDFANKVLTNDRMRGIIQNSLTGSIDQETQTIAYEIDPVNGLGYTEGTIPPETLYEIQTKAFDNVTRNIANDLLSMNSVGTEYVPILSDYIGLDIYLIRSQDISNASSTAPILYGGKSLHAGVVGPQNMRVNKDLPDRNAIVIISVGNYHYELVGRVDEKQKMDTVFSFDENEPLVRRLYKSLNEL